MRGSARIVMLVALTVCVPAAAQSPPAGDDKTGAERVFRRGQAHYNAGEYQQAADDFEKAYELYPMPIFLYNAAQGHRLEGNDERALYFYKVYLKMDPKSQLRAEVKQRIAELERSIAGGTTATAPPKPLSMPPPKPAVPPSGSASHSVATAPPNPPATPPAAVASSTPPPSPTPPSEPQPYPLPPPKSTTAPTTTSPAPSPAPAATTPAPAAVVATTPPPPTEKKSHKGAIIAGVVVGVVVVGVALGVGLGVGLNKPNAGPPAVTF